MRRKLFWKYGVLFAILAHAGCIKSQKIPELVKYGGKPGTIVFQDVTVFPATGTAASAHMDVLKLAMKISEFAAITSGETSSMAAFMGGKMKYEGPMTLLMKIGMLMA